MLRVILLPDMPEILSQRPLSGRETRVFGTACGPVRIKQVFLAFVRVVEWD